MWTGRREKVQKPAAVPLNDLKVLLKLVREQYLNMQNAALPRTSDCVCTQKDDAASVTCCECF